MFDTKKMLSGALKDVNLKHITSLKGAFTASIPNANELVCASMVTLCREMRPGTLAAAGPLTKMGPLI